MRNVLCALATLALVATGCGDNGGEDLPDKPLIQPDRIELNFGADFGNAVYVDSSVPDTVQLRNGGRQDLVISKVELSGPDADAFTITGDPAGTVESAQTTFVQVTYTPTTSGAHRATLTITSNADNNPTLTITLSPSAVWRYKSQGLVTSNEATPQPLSGIKVSCVKPKGATCTGDSDCLASGLTCTEGTCQNAKWQGWEATTGADGRFSADHSWECAEILARDGAATPSWASAAGAFKADGSDVNLGLDAVYTVHGKVVEAGSATGLADIKVTCMAPLSAPLSWSGWNLQTIGDGTFSSTHVWPCKELYAEDATNNNYLPATGTWSTAAAGVTIEMTAR